MNNKTKMFSNWSEVTSGERNQLVFENLNKSYGAYEIRNNYDKTLLKALFLIVITTLFIFGLSLFSSNIKPIIIIPDTPAIQIDPPIFELPTTPPIFNPDILPNGAKKPNTFSQPVVINDSIIPQDSTAPLLTSNTNVSTGGPGDHNDPEAGPTSSRPDPAKANPEISPDSVFQFPDVRPQFPGGDKELMRFLTSNTRIPESLIGNGKGLSEKLGVMFIIDRDGSITSASTLKGGCQYAELNKEAIRVINKMPKWEPGKQNGNAVKVRMILPFRFEVKN